MTSRYQKLAGTWRFRYEGSFAHDVVKGLGAVAFVDRIMSFGSTLLLTVFPLIIVLSAYTSHHIEEDIATHLGLSAQGGRVIEGLFRASDRSFHLAVLVSLLLSFAGTIAVARSVEVIYERTFEHSPLGRAQGWLRSTTWIVVVAAVAIGDGAIGKTLRDGPAGPLVLAVVEGAGFALFFWWSIHFLLGGRESWRRVFPAAVSTAILWIGLGLFAGFYFSTTIVADSKTYGTIGVTFTLVTWFIAMGAVVTLGALFGAVWQKRRTGAGVSHDGGDPG
ncbi:MAG: YihY/virulence factor BrkB family protein [Acidimicrobiaceae bacterium]|nr:YihY/virulence factor BrkB family protein [Acidimicrobiaceae bacterium]